MEMETSVCRTADWNLLKFLQVITAVWHNFEPNAAFIECVSESKVQFP